MNELLLAQTTYSDELGYAPIEWGKPDPQQQVFTLLNIILPLILLGGAIVALVGSAQVLSAHVNKDELSTARAGEKIFFGLLLMGIVLAIYFVSSFLFVGY